MRSPVLTNRGTWTTAPVSRVAGLVTFETVSPFTPGSVSDTASSTDADRKSTRLNSSHLVISYAVFCLKKKKRHVHVTQDAATVLDVALRGLRRVEESGGPVERQRGHIAVYTSTLIPPTETVVTALGAG